MVTAGDDAIGVIGEVWVGEGCEICTVEEVTWTWLCEETVGAVEEGEAY